MHIGNVAINLDAYGGSDTYSDGPVEDDLLRIVQEKPDLLGALRADHRWPVLYHLHPARENILAWYDFRGTEDVLEIGSGCGAVTGLLARKCRSVTCVDISLKRSQINAHRNAAYDNIEIHAGNYADVHLDRQFDMITLIGVLEYAPAYFPARDQDPFRSILGSVRDALADDGTAVIAIENKFGLKYWAGAREDHTSILYDSLEGYPSVQNVETFSRMELEQLLCSCGFSDIQFYYPFPDYKFAREIYSDRHLPRPGDLTDTLHNFDMARQVNFREERVLDEIIRAGQFPFFSNSFLVFAGKGEGANHE